MQLLIAVALCGAAQTGTFIEAGSFDDHGGWVVDQQAMDQMGSAYLLAHGMGVPVDDAVTTVDVPKAATYRVWARTRNWVASFGADGAPGRFKILVNGTPLSAEFGLEGAAWHWQDGGTVDLPEGSVRLALHDLTGFEGRCDAVYLTPDLDFVPPNEPKALLAFRRASLDLPETPETAGEFDLVVVGGGMAGTCTAISAARLGLNTALVQNRPVLGGNNSSEVRVHLGGRTNLAPYPNLGNLVHELDPGRQGNAKPAEYYDDGKKLRLARNTENLHLFLNMHAYAVERDGERIAAVLAKDIRTGRERRFPARVFADCTGDGCIGFLAGADWRMGRESRAETGESLAPEKADAMTMGASVQWYSVEAEGDAPFPECPWALQFTEENCQKVTMGEWDWETGMDRNQVTDIEQIRDHAFRVVYGNWAYLRNHSRDKEKYAGRTLGWVAYVAGKRESRRLMGDVVLQQQDIEGKRAFPDACVTTTWTIDLHYPEEKNAEQFPGQAFRSIAKHLRIDHYPIPYRCLYSRNVPNLFMAGRNISVTHVALGTVRVMRTCGMMGEVVGMAASLCVQEDTTPRGVYTDHLPALKALMEKGVGKPREVPGLTPPEWRASAGENLARSAKVTVSGNLDEAQYPPSNINDGRIDISGAAGRWVSARDLPQNAELAWDTPQTINAARIVSGWRVSKFTMGSAIDRFSLQYLDGGEWHDIPGAAASGNGRYDWSVRFSPVTTRKVRLVVTDSPGGIARIYEMELFNVR